MPAEQKKRGLTTAELLQRISIINVLDVEDVALFLKRTQSRIRHLVAAGLIPHYKDENGRVTFLKAEIEAWRLGKIRILTQDEVNAKADEYCRNNHR